MKASQNTKQSPHWLDQLVEEIIRWQQKNNIQLLHVDDMKTPSGRVHVGALRGVILHDLVAKALRQKTDQDIISTYVFNNMDNMDSLPGYLPAEYEKFMGHPLFKIPTPDLEHSGISFEHASAEEKSRFENASNLGEFYALDFIDAFTTLGATPEIVWSNQLYESGQMNDIIRKALNSVETMRAIYKEVADYNLPAKWYPFQVYCESCGACGSTLVTDWDGEHVTYVCQPEKVEWAKGCGHQGQISPFDGNGKLLWKVDWPAHWQVMGVTVEGAGKDHTSAGGSRDMANAMCERVFSNLPPFDIPYEWILVRGTKMSSSKGIGMSAKDFVQIMPPSVGRFLFTSRHYNQVIDFDPATQAIPDLFDEYDLAARIFWKEEEGDLRLGRSFELAQIGQIPEPHYLPRFRDLVQWVQFPNCNVEQECAKAKGSELTNLEIKVIAERIIYANRWLDTTAPEDIKFLPMKNLPEATGSLTDEQRNFLSTLNTKLDEHPDWSAEETHQGIFDLAKQSIGPRQAFQAIYLSIIGKTSGPKAGWLLHSLDPAFRNQRFAEVASNKSTQTQNTLPNLDTPELFFMSEFFREKYPSATVGIAVLRDVHITENNSELTEHINHIVDEMNISTESLSAFPEIMAYRKMYKSMGVDWHSRRPSPEALLRRIAQGKGFPRVNTCVDAYNLAVISNRVSVGAFNYPAFQFPTELTIANGNEDIDLLGSEERKKIVAGEVFYKDAVGPYNLDYNYRDAIRTAVTLESHDLLINVDGIFEIDRSKVEKTLSEAIELVTKYCGGHVEKVGIVSAS